MSLVVGRVAEAWAKARGEATSIERLVLGLTTLNRVFRAHATVEDAIGAGG